MPLAQTIECEALIVGSGASGLARAISAAVAGLEVVIIEKYRFTAVLLF